MQTYHVAQINIGRMRGPLDSEIMAGFVAQIETINALADQSPGFVWRLQGSGGDATSLRPYDDTAILVNMSVWESLDTLRNYVYRSAHTNVMRDRRAWFERFEGMYYALWWVPAGRHPTVAEAKSRLDHLREHGESPYAFTFRNIFPAPEE